MLWKLAYHKEYNLNQLCHRYQIIPPFRDWYYSALNSSTDAVIESVRITEGGNVITKYTSCSQVVCIDQYTQL